MFLFNFKSNVGLKASWSLLYNQIFHCFLSLDIGGFVSIRVLQNFGHGSFRSICTVTFEILLLFRPAIGWFETFDILWVSNFI